MSRNTAGLQQMNSAAGDGQRYAALDAWRGISALAVAFMHLNVWTSAYEVPFVRNAYLFVDYFFVLSGFVVTHAYDSRLGNADDFLVFAIRRFGRLWPLHATTLTALFSLELTKWWLANSGVPTATAAFSTEPYSPLSILTNLLLIHGLGMHATETWNFPSWSISAEFFTYLLFGALAVLLPSRGRALCFALLVIAALATIAALSPDFMDATVDLGIFRCIGGFLIGSLLYSVFVARNRGGRRRPGAFSASLAELGAIALVIAFVATAGRTTLSLAAPFVFAVPIWIFASGGGAVSGILGATAFQKLGEWSYSIYMVHAIVLLTLNRGADVVGRELEQTFKIVRQIDDQRIELIFWGERYWMDLLSIGYLSAVIALAALTYRFVEVPGRQLFSRTIAVVTNRRPCSSTVIP